jgi:hypothetical protein
MKPVLSILDRSFQYVPATATSVADTWRRFGWRPPTEEERDRGAGPPASFAANQALRLRVLSALPSRQRVLLTSAQPD